MTHDKILAYISIQKVRWGDMDALGHVNNTVYFRYMEQTRVEWLDSAGITLTSKNTEGFVVINAQCTFLQQITYPATVEIKMLLGAVGKSSINSFYELRLVGDDTLYATGEAKMVWANYSKGKSAPLPDYLLAKLPK